MRHIYSAILYLLLPLLVLRLLVRSIRVPAYRQRLAERFGYFSVSERATDSPVLWVHAVSLGEVQAAAPLVTALLRDYPNYCLVLTTTTPAGSQQVRRLFGERVFHVYLPWDLPAAVRRFHQRLNPRVLLLLETELWPNLITLSEQSGCRCLLVNARMSQRSARRYAYLRRFTAQFINHLSHVACQTPKDAQRFAELGIANEKLSVTGSLKYEVSLDETLQQQARQLAGTFALGQRPVWVAASTHEGEEHAVLQAFAQLREQFPDVLLVLAPRSAERFAAVGKLCAAQGFAYTRRTAQVAVPADHALLLVDTLGELPAFFHLASIAFVGGSLVRHGGHNPLEAALCGVPVISGPHVHNFADVYGRLRAASAACVVHDALQLARAAHELLSDDAECHKRGLAGAAVVAESRGALPATLGLLATTLRG